MKPLRDIVLIRPDEPEQKTESGLYIKEDWKTLPPIGTVEAVGDEVKLVETGDRVMFLRYAVIDVGEGLRAAKEKHLLAVINGED